MSEIINTGLGWWANEDWLKSDSGLIASIESGTITWPQAPKIPNGDANAATFNESLYVGSMSSEQHSVFTYNNDAVYVAIYKDGSSYYGIYLASRTPFTWNGITKYLNYPGVYSKNSSGPASGRITQFDFYEGYGYVANYLLSSIPEEFTIYNSLNDARNAFNAFAPIDNTTIYKLNPGYAITCGVEYINRNMETVTAPVIISTDAEYVKFSLDGTTEEPGLLTGIEFGDMMFYINILLLGISGEFDFDCEYADIRNIYPSGANITDIFRAIVTLAQVKFSEPYQEGGISGPGGGGGTFDNTTVPVDFPGLPTLSATDTGFITLFNPSKAQLAALSDYMWNNPLFDLDTWKKIIADPMDAILGLAIVPVNVTPGGTKSLTIGNISTSVTMTEAARQYEELDCGTLSVTEYWGAYLDYDPYTKAEIYLPYIGTHPISVDDIMGKTIHIKYHVDILSGACCAYIKCGDSVLYTFMGQCASSIPIAAKDLTNVINGVLSAASSIGAMVATGGASAPSAVPGLVSTATNALKPHIEKSGSMSGTGGMLGPQTPYLIITRPRQALPGRQHEFIGYPAFETVTLGSLSGYTEVESIHPENIPATKAELSEIETLLGNGVIF